MHVCTLICACSLAVILFSCSPCTEHSPLLINVILPCCKYTASHFLPTRMNNFFCSFFYSSLLPFHYQDRKTLLRNWLVHEQYTLLEKATKHTFLRVMFPILRKALHPHYTHHMSQGYMSKLVSNRMPFHQNKVLPWNMADMAPSFSTQTVTEVCACITRLALITQDTITSLSKHVNMYLLWCSALRCYEITDAVIALTLYKWLVILFSRSSAAWTTVQAITIVQSNTQKIDFNRKT